MKNRHSWLTATLISVVLVVIATATLSRYSDHKDTVFVVGTFASIFSFFIASLQFVNSLQSRVADKSEPFRKPGRIISFALFSLLGFISAGLLVLGAVNFAALLTGVESLKFGTMFYTVILPVAFPILFMVLDFKVRAVRMLDMQKASLKEIGRVLNNWRLESLDQLPHLNSASPALLQSYHHLLEALCQRALFAASLAGHQEHRNLAGLTAVLFLANTKERHFVPVAVAGGTPNYRNALESFRPPFFDVKEFQVQYNKFYRMYRTKRLRRQELADILQAFRKVSKKYVSTSGIIYAIERRLVFSDNLYGKCLAFRFEFLEHLPEEEKAQFHFRQVVGIPVSILGRKVGVLLLMAARGRVFYTQDKIYWLIGDMVGAGVHLGVSLGAFNSPHQLGDLYRDAPPLKSDEDLKEIIDLINELASDFSRPCPDIDEQNENSQREGDAA